MKQGNMPEIHLVVVCLRTVEEGSITVVDAANHLGQSCAQDLLSRAHFLW